MDRAEKVALLLAGILTTVAFVAIVFASYGMGVMVPTSIKNVKPYDKDTVIQVSDNHYEIYYIARMWSFFPQEVKLPAGSTVDIYVTSTDVIHGFNIAKKAVNLMAVPNAVNHVRLKFDEPGKYDIVCHEYCGVGHQMMHAQIIVYNPQEVKDENQ